MLKDNPLGRLIAPEEVAAAVLFLCRPDAAGHHRRRRLPIAGGEM